jgi:hypothetical protein
MRTLVAALVVFGSAALPPTAALANDGEARAAAELLAFDARLEIEAPASDVGGLRLSPLALVQPEDALGKADGGGELPKLRRVASFADDTRVFWYAAGASAITSLATRVMMAIPGFFLLAGVTAAGPALGPFGGWIMLLTGWVVSTVIDASVSALAGSFVYDNVSKFYESSFFPGFAGQLAGGALANGVLWMTIGYGLMLTTGLDLVSPFAPNGAFEPIGIFSALGVMPALVIAFLASVALPAVVGTWALAATAKPKEGYVIDPLWRPLDARRDIALAPEPRYADDRAPISPALSLAFD